MHRRQFLRFAALLPVLGLTPPAYAGTGAFHEGIDYQRIARPLPPAHPGKAEVLALFWYGCPHCHQLEPSLGDWRKRHPGVAFDRLSAVLGDSWAIHARAYYAAEALGLIERLHGPLFEAIHTQGRRLNTEDALAAFVATQGGDAEAFRRAMRSTDVDEKVRQAAETTRRIAPDGVPALLVNGRFLTSPTLTGSRARTLAVLDALVANPDPSI